MCSNQRLSWRTLRTHDATRSTGEFAQTLLHLFATNRSTTTCIASLNGCLRHVISGSQKIIHCLHVRLKHWPHFDPVQADFSGKTQARKSHGPVKNLKKDPHVCASNDMFCIFSLTFSVESCRGMHESIKRNQHRSALLH